jgi:hypothetical protein
MLNSWKRLDLAIVTATEPYLFIDRPTQSPFNVGEVFTLHDFSRETVDELNQRHPRPASPDRITQLYALLHGHPYLTRRALYAVARVKPDMSVDELFASALDDFGLFGDHLRYYLLRLREYPDRTKAFLQILRRGEPPDQLLAFRLESAGLVRREGAQYVARCQLYATYFLERLQ